MINKVDTGIPTLTNNRVIEKLYQSTSWGFASDDGSRSVDKIDRGFLMSSYSDGDPNFQIEVLNIYANIILDAVCDKSFFQYRILRRFFWNWYHSNCETDFHQDNVADNQISIIYNLHENDGGTEFIINNKNIFYKSNESEALVFPSLIKHRGVSPKKNKQRFSLNIIYYI